MDAVEINTSNTAQNVEGDGIVSTVEICRVCLLGNLVMRDLFLETEVASLSAKAMSFTNVKMLPGDGLPARVCCICADKLESAYEFKLQVEQADTVLRERFVAMSMKEELFFNEVEVHLESGERHESMEEIQMDTHYESPAETLSSMERDEDKSSLLKDQLALLQVEKLAEEEDTVREQDNGLTIDGSKEVEETVDNSVDRHPTDENSETIGEEVKNEIDLKCEDTVENTADVIPTEEHNYILQQECMLSNDNEQQHPGDESFAHEENTEEEYIDALVETEAANQDTVDESQSNKGEAVNDANSPDIRTEQDSQSQNETRRSKRKLVRRSFAAVERDSDEENYFENLNLSSRLKKAQASDKSEKIFFMCYLCDKQFLSKNVLKEHMHSHEEVRRALSLKKTPEKTQKITPNTSPTKMPPSGKRANKCPYCGKEYLYVISFSKHLKQHEREKEETKEVPMPLEISFHEDEHSLDLDDYEGRRLSDVECRKRTRRRDENDLNDDQPCGDDTEKQKKRARTEMFPCDKCSEKFYTRRGLRKHAISHISLKCSVCGEEFDSLEKLRDHRAKHVVEGVLTEQDLEDTKHTIHESEYRLPSEEKQMQEGFGNQMEEDEEEAAAAAAAAAAADDDSMESIGSMGHEEDGVDYEEEEEQAEAAAAREFVEGMVRRNGRNGETHSEIGYSCKLCGERFARKDQLQKHAEQHGRVKSFKCTQCNKTFGNELTLRNHLIATNHKTFIHGQEYDPNKRIKRVAAKAAQKIIDKIKTEDGLEDYDDEEDDKEDRTGFNVSYGRGKREVSSQKRCNYRKELECASCNKRCSSKQSLTKHMEQHVKDEKLEKKDKLDKLDKFKKGMEKKDHRDGLDNDDNEDDDDSDFESGLDWPMDNHECTTCKKRYSTKKSLLRHQLLHEEPNFECDICNVKFYRKDKLKAHYDKCSEKNPDQVRKCNICGDSFENNEILREHRSKHVTEGILTEEDLRDIEPRPEEKRQGEKIGRKRRTDIVGLECTECNKQYTSRKGLLRHIQVHEGKKYLCDICPKKFYRREHLKIHVAKHNMIKPYKCTRCTKRFIKEEQLTNHLSKHDRTFKKNKETDSSKRFLCEICSKSFTQSTTLIAHLRAHNGIKPYVCEVCSRPFTTNAYLKMHMRTHTQERPYICQYCSRAFARADTLANHLTSHTGEAKYHCKYCPKNFRRLKSLKEHVFIHTGQRPYACPTCDRRFNNNGSRYAHSKRCKQNFVQNQNQNRTQTLTQVQPAQNPQRVSIHQTALGQAQVVKAQNIKTITIARQSDTVTAQQVMQHQEILMPLILPLTVTLTDVGEEVILPEGTKIYTTS